MTGFGARLLHVPLTRLLPRPVAYDLSNRLLTCRVMRYLSFLSLMPAPRLKMPYDPCTVRGSWFRLYSTSLCQRYAAVTNASKELSVGMSYWPPRFSLNFGAFGRRAPARLATFVLLYFGFGAQLPPGTVPVPAAFSTL